MAAAGAVAGAAAVCYCLTQKGSKPRKSEAEKQVLTHALLTAEFDHVAEGVDHTQEGAARGGKLSWSAYSQVELFVSLSISQGSGAVVM